MLISNHTFSNLVLRPNGVNPNTVGHDGMPVGDAPDEAALKKLGARMAAQNGYANIHGWQLYDTTGTTEDWSYNATGGFGYTFEIGANEFHPPYPEVVDEYLGAGDYRGKGNREAYLIALEHAVDKRFSGVLTGKAPKGAVIRLKKSFQTPTWSGSFQDGVNTAITVGRGGDFSWIVNPSTRPVVQPRPYQQLADHAVPQAGLRGHQPRPEHQRRPRVRAHQGRRPVADHARLADPRRPRPRGLPQGRRRDPDRGRLLRQPARPEGDRRDPRRARRARTCCEWSTTPRRLPSYTLTAALFDDPDPSDRRQARGLHPHLREAREGPPDRPRLHRPR